MPRKILILGSAKTALRSVPIDDPSWEKWAIGVYDLGDAARLFEMHPDPTVAIISGGNHLQHLAGAGVPVYMRHPWPEIPTSVAYPFDAVRAGLGTSVDWFSGTAPDMMALAVHEISQAGVGPGDTIGLYGVEALLDSPHAGQRPALWALKVLAESRGIAVQSPPESILFRHEEYGAPTPVGGGLTMEALSGMCGEYEALYDKARVELHTFNGARQALGELRDKLRHTLKGGKVLW